jgi:hypothetical protein
MSEPAKTFVDNGRVLNLKGDVVAARVRYEVRIYNRHIEDSPLLSGPGEIIGIMPRLECDLHGLPKNLSSMERFTLVMSDKNRLNFYVGVNGAVMPTGGIYEQ